LSAVRGIEESGPRIGSRRSNSDPAPRSTNIIGERFYIYASQKWAEGKLLMEDAPEEGRGQKAERSEIRSQRSEGSNSSLTSDL